MALDGFSIFRLFKLKHTLTSSRFSSFVYFTSTALTNICGAFFLGSKDYGEVSLFLAQAGLVSSFVSLRQELLIPTSHMKIKTTFDPIIIAIVVSSVLIFAHSYLGIGFDFWAVTTGAFLAINNALQTFYLSTSNFALLTYARITLALPIIGLIITNRFWPISFFSDLSRSYALFICILTIPLVLLLIKNINQSLWQCILAIRPKKLGLLAIPADFVNSNTQLIPIAAISNVFGAALAGNYTLAVKMLSIPVSIFTRFFIDYIVRYLGPSRDSYLMRSKMWKRYKSMACIIIPIAFLFMLFSLNASHGSSNTVLSGFILSILSLSPAFLLKALASPVSYVLYIWNGSHYDLSFQIIFYIMMAFACTMHSSFTVLITAISLATFASYLVYSLLTFRFIANHEARYT